MDEVWARLQALTIRIYADDSPYETDRANTQKLNQRCDEGNWKSFYEGIDALELGYGYSDHSELTALCKAASLQDDKRLLQVIEQKTKLLDMVLFLRSVELAIKLAWINSCSFTRTPALFECLRQVLADAGQNGPGVDVIVKGLCNLQEKSSEHFRYLLSHDILYQEKMIPVASKLLECLSKEGWATLSQCISFDDANKNRMRFWDQCASRVDWDTVYSRAEPLLNAWGSYIAQSLLGCYRQSLYCNVSNMLITLLICKLDTIGQYLDVMERTLCAGETAMYGWFERETQQFGALIACLSVIGHLRYVWMHNPALCDKPFSEGLRSRCLSFIAQWRYLWSSHENMAGKEILQLENWLKCVSTAPVTSGTIEKE